MKRNNIINLILMLLFLFVITICGSSVWKLDTVIKIIEIDKNAKAFYIDENKNIYYDSFNDNNKYCIKKINDEELKVFNYINEITIDYKYYSKTNYIDFKKNIFITGYMSDSIYISNLNKDENRIIKIKNLKDKYLLTCISQFHKSNKVYRSYYNSEYSSLESVFYRIYNNYLFIKIVSFSDIIYEPYPHINFLKINLDTGIVEYEKDETTDYIYNKSIITGIDLNGNVITGIPCYNEINKKLNKKKKKLINKRILYRSNNKNMFFFSNNKAYLNIEINNIEIDNSNNVKQYLNSVSNAIIIYDYIDKEFKINNIIYLNVLIEDSNIIIDEILYAKKDIIYLSIRRVCNEDYILSNESNKSKRKYERELWELSYE